SVNGGADLSSASNTVSNVLPGVTLNLSKIGSTVLTVSQDTSKTTGVVQDFVDQFNKALGMVRDDLKYDSTTKTAGVLFGDTGVQLVGSHLRTLVSGLMTDVSGNNTYQSLM